MMSALPADHSTRIARAELSLTGLSIGDAFGERFFGEPDRVRDLIATRTTPRMPWGYTDDTVMALSVFEILERYGRVEQDALASAFGAKYLMDPNRGYGAGAHRLLHAVGRGADWRHASRASFGGVGSFGNGGGMRVAPIKGKSTTSVLKGISDDLESFYGNVVEHLAGYVAPAPKLPKEQVAISSEPAVAVESRVDASTHQPAYTEAESSGPSPGAAVLEPKAAAVASSLAAAASRVSDERAG
jgi:hypothetical protein